MVAAAKLLTLPWLAPQSATLAWNHTSVLDASPKSEPGPASRVQLKTLPPRKPLSLGPEPFAPAAKRIQTLLSGLAALSARSSPTQKNSTPDAGNRCDSCRVARPARHSDLVPETRPVRLPTHCQSRFSSSPANTASAISSPSSQLLSLSELGHSPLQC